MLGVTPVRAPVNCISVVLWIEVPLLTPHCHLLLPHWHPCLIGRTLLQL